MTLSQQHAGIIMAGCLWLFGMLIAFLIWGNDHDNCSVCGGVVSRRGNAVAQVAANGQCLADSAVCGHEISKTEWGYGGGAFIDHWCRWCNEMIEVPAAEHDPNDRREDLMGLLGRDREEP